MKTRFYEITVQSVVNVIVEVEDKGDDVLTEMYANSKAMNTAAFISGDREALTTVKLKNNAEIKKAKQGCNDIILLHKV
jgi:hypothetical protein